MDSTSIAIVLKYALDALQHGAVASVLQTDNQLVIELYSMQRDVRSQKFIVTVEDVT
jgi:hypothetical protein